MDIDKILSERTSDKSSVLNDGNVPGDMNYPNVSDWALKPISLK
jgi:hypothetical protein